MPALITVTFDLRVLGKLALGPIAPEPLVEEVAEEFAWLLADSIIGRYPEAETVVRPALFTVVHTQEIPRPPVVQVMTQAIRAFSWAERASPRTEACFICGGCGRLIFTETPNHQTTWLGPILLCDVCHTVQMQY